MPLIAGAVVVLAFAGASARHYHWADRMDARPVDLRRAADRPERTTMRDHAATSGMIV